MPVIAFVSPKGGAGKTTASLILATMLNEAGAGVTIIDADPETYIAKWGDSPHKPSGLKIVSSPTEETIIDDITKATRESAFVIIDLEGTASMLVALAISRSDLVIIPLQASAMDAKAAAKAVKQVKTQEKHFNCQIPFALLFTRSKAAIRTKGMEKIQDDLQNTHVPAFHTHLFEREAYRKMFSTGRSLQGMNPNDVYNLKGAIENAQEFTGEVLKFLKQNEQAQQAQPKEVNEKEVEVA